MATILPFSRSAAGEDEDEDEDDDYNESGQEDISLGSHDTDINEEEIDDIIEEETMPRTPKKTAAAKKTPTKVLEEKMSKLNLTEKKGSGTSFKLQYEVREGNKQVAYYEMLTCVGSDFLRHCKVLPGGMKLSVLFGYPRALASERASRKILEAEGIAYNPDLARVAARATQVEHVVNNLYDLEEDILDGEPQVVDLKFKCEEGPLTGRRVSWFKWRKKGGNVTVDGRVHMQYYDIMIIKVVSQETFTTGRENSTEYTLVDSENSSDEENNMEDDPNL